MVETLAPEIAASPPGTAPRAARARSSRSSLKIGGERRAGWLGLCRHRTPTTRTLLREAAASAERRTQPINIQFTSGTTGLPKGRDARHIDNIVNNGYFVGDAHGIARPATGSAFRCRSITASAWCCANLACVMHGATMVYPSRRLRSAHGAQGRASRALHRAAMACPPCSSPSCSTPSSDRSTSESLRAGIMAGAPCPIEMMRRVDRSHAHARGDHRLWHDRDEPGELPELDRHDPIERRVSTVGRIQPHMEAKVIDAEGRIAPRGDSRASCARVATR